MDRRSINNRPSGHMKSTSGISGGEKVNKSRALCTISMNHFHRLDSKELLKKARDFPL